MSTLTESQINELYNIAHSGESEARIEYYSKLSEYGIQYGNLAIGVVLNDQISGRIATWKLREITGKLRGRYTELDG
ncbi:hypothetical protein [Zavarzinia aquatilis]|uniref:hypothetical protein n=1 Tax=Zavarzinia aquatilis TaxID=2211142 RepID=UPI001057B57F|nr:hypothetical protein [Zavarzinia aquatilis]